MMRRVFAAAAGLGALLSTGVAGAQPVQPGEFGQQGQFIFSADRLFPFFAFTSDKADVANTPNGVTANTTVNQTSISFFGSNYGSTVGFDRAGAASNFGGISTFFSVPRLGFDYSIIDHVTVGGDLILFFTLGGSASTHTQNGGTTTDTSTGSPSLLVFGFAPRAGYVLNFSPLLSVWLRGGLSYYRGQSKTTNTMMNPNVTTTSSADTFAIDLDPQLVISPVPHFAFTAGPALDIGFGGHLSNDVQAGGTDNNTSVGYSQINFSINVGMLGWFGG
jgi:hypothetical protein